MTAARETVPAWQFGVYVDAEAHGDATAEQLAVLDADRAAWGDELQRLLREAEDFVVTARSLQGDDRDWVLTDAQAELRRLAAAWDRFNGGSGGGGGGGGETQPRRRNRRQQAPEVAQVPGVVRLQVSWRPGRVVAWCAGPRTRGADADEVLAMLAAGGAPTTGWVSHAAVPLPGGVAADAFAAPVGDILGWLVAVGAGQVGDDVGASVRWLGRVAVWAVELTARGAMVPLLLKRKKRGTDSGSASSFAVRWTPASVDAHRLEAMAAELPGSVLALDATVAPRALTRSALTGMVDAICRDSARRIDVPAPPPNVRTASDVTEAFLARLDGSAFDAPVRVAADLVTRTASWARSVTDDFTTLVVRLDPPDRSDAWLLEVFAPVPAGSLTPIERAIVDAGSGRGALEGQLTRLERMLPALLRPSAVRGRVILDPEEAWDLMATTGASLADAGFDVRIP
jgi:hypothetical protein